MNGRHFIFHILCGIAISSVEVGVVVQRVVAINVFALNAVDVRDASMSAVQGWEFAHLLISLKSNERL